MKPESAAAAPVQDRLFTLDAFRGFTMVWMLSEGFGLLNFRKDPILGPIAIQFTHKSWEGVFAWDLVAPFFIFIVGATMPASFGRRWREGESWRTSLWHVLKRVALLIALGSLATSVQKGRPVIDLLQILSQIAVAYLITFLVLRAPWKVQGLIALAILWGNWAAYQLVQAPAILGPYAKGANLGSYLDRVLLGYNWPDGYVTFVNIPTSAYTICGAMCGAMLLSDLPVAIKIRNLVLPGIAAVLAGLALSPWIPMIKKLRTPSFAFFSLGVAVLALALLYWVCDVQKKRAWAHVFKVVGLNSIFIYMIHELLHPWMMKSGLVFTKWALEPWGPPGVKALDALLVLAFEIYLCFWMYRRKIFLKI